MTASTGPPTDPIEGKRTRLSYDYYQALVRPDVEIVNSGIAEVRPDGLVTEDGQVHDVDAVILGSGFGVSVSALRLTEKGHRVAVLEAGKTGRTGVMSGPDR